MYSTFSSRMQRPSPSPTVDDDIVVVCGDPNCLRKPCSRIDAEQGLELWSVGFVGGGRDQFADVESFVAQAGVVAVEPLPRRVPGRARSRGSRRRDSALDGGLPVRVRIASPSSDPIAIIPASAAGLQPCRLGRSVAGEVQLTRHQYPQATDDPLEQFALRQRQRGRPPSRLVMASKIASRAALSGGRSMPRRPRSSPWSSYLCHGRDCSRPARRRARRGPTRPGTRKHAFESIAE